MGTSRVVERVAILMTEDGKVKGVMITDTSPAFAKVFAKHFRLGAKRSPILKSRNLGALVVPILS
jgi:hypothetical protein